MIRRPPRSTRTDTLFPYTTLFRSDLTAARILRVGERGAGRGRAFLERRVERDLGILLVEDILRPEFDAPFLVGSAHAEARVEQRIAVLRSEEHTSELQSLMRISYAVFCLKKKIYSIQQIIEVLY